MSDRGWVDVPDEFALPPGAALRELTGAEISPFTFVPPGPIGEEFVFGEPGPIDYLMGPAGSGKTVCGIMRTLVTALSMPACKDGVIRCRVPVVRDNFRTLYRTTLPSIFRFFPRDFPGAKFEGGQDRPFCFTLRFVTPKGQRVQLVIDGFGIGNTSVEELLKGYECNGGWQEEADLQARNVKTFLFGRAAQGRYPGRALLADPDAPLPRSIWGTLNPPLISHWVYEDFVEKPMGGHRLLRQPSGLSDRAENRTYSKLADYEVMATTMKPDEKRRQVDGDFGLVGDGALVYPEFNAGIHIATAALAPLDLPLMAGFDAKGTPAGALFQFTPKGQLRVLDEVVGEPNMSAGRFATAMLDLLRAKYQGLPIRHGWGDPSGFYGADRAAGEMSHLEIVGKTLSLNILPTATNDPKMRQEAVSWFLRRPSDPGDLPYFLISPTCKLLIGGFMGNFMIKLNSFETSDRISFVKNKFSHPHDALQYGAYGVRGHAGLMDDAARAGRPGSTVTPFRSIRVKSDFNP